MSLVHSPDCYTPNFDVMVNYIQYKNNISKSTNLVSFCEISFFSPNLEILTDLLLMNNFSQKHDSNKEKLLKILIEKSYKKGNFTLASGKKSAHYLNCKPVSLNGPGLKLISNLFLDLMDPSSKAVAGLTLGADPLVSGVIVTAASKGLLLDGLIIRKEIKQYGTKAGIEGPILDEGLLVTVLEDVVTTAGSAIKAINKLRENNFLVKEVISIVDRKEGGYEALREQNIQLKSLFSIKDFV